METKNYWENVEAAAKRLAHSAMCASKGGGCSSSTAAPGSRGHRSNSDHMNVFWHDRALDACFRSNEEAYTQMEADYSEVDSEDDTAALGSKTDPDSAG